MEISGETFRGISREYGYLEDALSRHKANHLILDLSEVNQAKNEARSVTLEKVKTEELAQTKANVAGSMAARLDNAANHLDRLQEVRREAANLLDRAEKADDLKAAGVFLRELREQIRLWAELEGRLATQPTVNILINPQWVELRTAILLAVDNYPEAKAAICDALEHRRRHALRPEAGRVGERGPGDSAGPLAGRSSEEPLTQDHTQL